MIYSETLTTYYKGCQFILNGLSTGTGHRDEWRPSISGIYFSAYATGDVYALPSQKELMKVLAKMIDIALGHTLITIENTLFAQKAFVSSFECYNYYSPHTMDIKGCAVVQRFHCMPLLKTSRRLFAKHEWNPGFPVAQP